MGIEWNTGRFLVILASSQSGVKFTKTLTLGKQILFIDRKVIRSLFRQFGSLPPTFNTAVTNDHYAEGLFSLLGAQEVISLDASDFEGASFIHNLNEPLPESHKGLYDFVFDGGTLEHVFNYPVALRSAMEAVRIGGHLLLVTPINNYCGHGFYQFSPELFYRALSEDNGFKIERMIAFAAFPGSRWFEVPDPAQLGTRLEIAYDPHRVLLLVLAKRTHAADIFKTMPIQSDYVAKWDNWKKQPRASATPDTRYSLAESLQSLLKSGKLPVLLRPLSALWYSRAGRRQSTKAQPKLFRAIDY